jgi:hypothetical protein
MSDTGHCFAASIVRYAASSLLPHSSRYTADRQANQQRRISRLRTIILFYSFCRPDVSTKGAGCFTQRHVEHNGHP